MISKKFRLTERQVKKVLTKSKPFFSYGVVLNILPNKLGYPRFGIVIGAKSVNTNITRNFFRRYFYEFVRMNILLSHLPDISLDFVAVVKKQTKLDRKDKNSIISFNKDLNFIFKKYIKHDSK